MKQLATAQKSAEISNDDDDEEDISEVPSLASIAVDVDKPQKTTLTLGDVLLKPTPPDYKPSKRKELDEFLDDKR